MFQRFNSPRWIALFLAVRIANVRFRYMQDFILRDPDKDFFTQASSA
jgi:hypothetical protein